MARTPRASVSKTSGQGVSRLSYQKGRNLGGNIGSVKASGIKMDAGPDIKGPGTLGSKRSYGKDEAGGMNISYGETISPTDLADVKALGELKLPRTKPLGSVKSKQLK